MHPVLFRLPISGWNLPFLGQLGVVPIYSYGVMLGLSLVVGWYLTLGLCARAGLDREQMANCYVVTAVVAILGSRVMFLVTNPQDFHTLSDVFAFRGGGLVAYGGFLGGFLGSFAYLKLKRIRLLPWADAAIPSLASGLVITRIGCYLFGCDYGRPLGSSAPAWLARLGTFPKWSEGTVAEGSGSPAWVEHLSRGLISPTATASLPVHPTQLYESLVGGLLLVLLFSVRKQQRFRGQLFFVGTFVYGVLRFLLELVRDDPERGTVPFTAPRHMLLPVCFALFAIAFTLTVSQLVVNPLVRKALQLVSFVPTLAAAIALQPDSFSLPARVALSTSQFLGLASALAVAVLYWIHDRAADANPAAAMALEFDAPGTSRPSELRSSSPDAPPPDDET